MVVIQGAGIAGLTLAGILEKHDVNYRLIERSPQLQAIGAGIVLQRNALEVLAQLREGNFEAVSTPIERMVIGSIEEPALQAMELDCATRSRGVHRGDLQRFLLQQIDQERLHLNTSVKSWTQNETGLDISLTSGEQLHARVLVGADGISSSIRTSMTGTPNVRDSGQWCARTVICGQPTGSDACEIHAGRYRLGAVPLADGCTYVFWARSRHSSGNVPNEDIESSIRSMGVLGEALAAHFAPTQQWLQHPLVDIPVFWGKGPVVLIGDAAHALTPNFGQGAALGIEDAWVLAALITNGDIDTRELTEKFRDQRHSRVRNIRTFSYFMGRVAHVEQPLLRRFRNRMLKDSSPERSRAGLSRWLAQFAVDGSRGG